MRFPHHERVPSQMDGVVHAKILAVSYLADLA
jgi:hypothetical protein